MDSHRIQLYRDTGDGSLTIRVDKATGLPLLSEKRKILRLIMNYLPLPYSIVEYGCGQKASIILRSLAVRHGIFPQALKRGLILEPDLSGEALDQTDHRKRPFALTARNPRVGRSNRRDPVLRKLIEEASIGIDVTDSKIQAGDYELSDDDPVQFIRARSHVYVVLILWDESRRRSVERVLDPTLDPGELFPAGELRRKLTASESLIFSAPLMGRFRLDRSHITPSQQEKITSLLGSTEELEGLSADDHARLVRDLTNAPEDSLGDPRTWSYLNNISIGEDRSYHCERLSCTGRGEKLSTLTRQLLEARAGGAEDGVADCRRFLNDLTESLELRRVLQEDAERAERDLAPLAEVSMVFSYHLSVRLLAKAIETGENLYEFVSDPNRLSAMHGIGVRLRSRVEEAARLSLDEEGRIDARALNPRYFRVAVETIRQMNKAGLSVFVDRVGSLHGLWIDDSTRAGIRARTIPISRLTGSALCFGSHIDTVFDAGKFDGRLGVFSGIEIVHLLSDLDRFFGLMVRPTDHPCPLMVSVYTGEEMTFTGRGVSLPGSAAVAGLATPELVHEMTNGDDERYGDRMVEFLRHLRAIESEGRIELMNDLSDDGDRSPLRACFEPVDFFAPRHYERHIEQGAVLHQSEIPLAPADIVMGIRHEDFIIHGARAEAAGFDLIRRFRLLTDEPEFTNVRVTAGILKRGEDSGGEGSFPVGCRFARRWILAGESNHAGTTAKEDRRDAGVAAGRLVRRFLEEIETVREQSGRRLKPLVAEGALYPGGNRNVIPSQATVTLGIIGEIPEAVAEKLHANLLAFVREALSLDVAAGGEGIHLQEATPANSLRAAGDVRLATDSRTPQAGLAKSFRRAVDREIASVEEEFGVEISNEIHQDSAPVDLANSGQLLQLERSYGGSHNPKETELAADILRGTLFQLALTREALENGNSAPLNLFKLARNRLPADWRRSVEFFMSGGFHDTCNIAIHAGENEPAAY